MECAPPAPHVKGRDVQFRFPPIRLFDPFDPLASVTPLLAMRRPLLLAVIGLVLVNPGQARAVDKLPPLKPVRLKIRSIVGLARSQAPLTFEIGLECDPGKFYEGRLELKWYVGRRLVHEFLSHDLAVTGGGQLLRVTLPPI